MNSRAEEDHTLPAKVRADCDTRASGAAGWLVEPSMEFEPAPPVEVQVPADTMPSAPIGNATTLFDSSLLIMYIAFAVELPAQESRGIAHASSASPAARRRASVCIVRKRRK